MKDPHRIKVFLAHGFLEKPIHARFSEVEIAEKIKQLLKRRRFDVTTGHPTEVDDIDKKIKRRIDEADVVLGIFCRRYKVTDGTDETMNRFVAPPFVLSECSYALGSHQSLEQPKLVGGFFEEGVEIKDLALVTAGGRELLSFDPDFIDDAKVQSRIIEYIDSIPNKLGWLQKGEELLSAPYLQDVVRKVVTVRGDGSATFKNYYRVSVRDTESFKAADGKILHQLYTDRPVVLPDLELMRRNPVTKRHAAPFFAFKMLAVNHKPPQLVSRIIAQRRTEDHKIPFVVEIDPLPKGKVVLEYEYAWGVPHLFAATSAELNHNEHNEVSLRGFHGTIKEAEVELNFETDENKPELGVAFATPPFYELAPQASLTSALFGRPKNLPLAKESIWDRTYNWRKIDFYGSVRISWRPK